MNNLVSNFDKVLEFAAQYDMPANKQRGIIREYLQSKFISWLYGLGNSSKLSFVGGTSLRLLRGVDRFSEDLDFDNLGLSKEEIRSLMEDIEKKFDKENIAVELVVTDKNEKYYFELRFPSLLYQLKISSNPKEKLKIKVDYAQFWQAQKTEVVLFNRYGFLEQVVSNPLNQLLVQKMRAYVGRTRTQPRDIYDVVWLYAQGARWDEQFEQVNGLEGVLDQAAQKFAREGITPQMKRRLAPFLFEQQSLRKLDHFEMVIEELSK